MVRTQPEDFFDMLERGSHEHYDDAEYYDKRYQRRRDDVEFYRALVRQRGGPVLELGAGSGRVSIPIARDGATVWAMDPSVAMLERARQGSATLPRGSLTLREGDMRDFSFRKRFPLIVAPFNVLMHLYEPVDFARCFRCVARHLAPDGRFVFDVRMPNLRELALDPDREYAGRPFVHPSLGPVKYTEQFQYDPIKQVQYITMRFRTTKKKVTEVVLAHRQIFPAELRALLELGGLKLSKRMGDFSGKPLFEEAEVQIIEARRADTKL
jgi:SAM-dependent methyltransferase